MQLDSSTLFSKAQWTKEKKEECFIKKIIKRLTYFYKAMLEAAAQLKF